MKNIRHMEICCQDIKVAMCADKVGPRVWNQTAAPDDNSSLSVGPVGQYELALSAACFVELVVGRGPCLRQLHKWGCVTLEIHAFATEKIQ